MRLSAVHYATRIAASLVCAVALLAMPSPAGAGTSRAPAEPQVAGVARAVSFFDIDARFRTYYGTHDGHRLLGRAIAPPGATADGAAAQLFEKGRLEDRRAFNRTGNPAYDFEYGLLVDELKAAGSAAPIGGDRSTLTYAGLGSESAPSRRIAPPAGFTGNVAVRPDGSVFVPFSAALAPTAGHIVPAEFWSFLNRADLFPGGWLHDVGLPVTPALAVKVDKGIVVGGVMVLVTDRPIVAQAFQRAILTWDPLNPLGWQAERANVGTDYWTMAPEVAGVRVTGSSSTPTGIPPIPSRSPAAPPPTRPAVATSTIAPTATPRPAASPTAVPTATRPPTAGACGMSEAEETILRLMRSSPEQRRPSLTCHPTLAQVARNRAADMARRNYFSHTDLDGYGPNYHVRAAGYVLPQFYSTARDGNNVESISAGRDTAAATWDSWMTSPGHKTHLVGLAPFYAEQLEAGIGYVYAPESYYRHYWVAITAKRGP